MRLYLNVETCRPRKKDAFTNEVITTIGVVEGSTPYIPDSVKVWSEHDAKSKF